MQNEREFLYSHSLLLLIGYRPISNTPPLCKYMSIQIHFGQNVRLAREKKGWSQDRLSEESGLHRTYISGIERGVRNPTIEIVQQIAVALDVDIQELFANSKTRG